MVHIICPMSRQLFCGATLAVLDGSNEHTVAQVKAGDPADYCPKCLAICRDTLAAGMRAHAQQEARVEPMRAAEVEP